MDNGKIPVRDFLYSLEPKLRAKAFRDIELLKSLGSELREPYVKPIKGVDNKGLYIRGGIIMNNASISFEEMKNDLLQDVDFKTEYEKLKPRYEAIAQIIKARKEQNITQAELAKRVGTQKSNISRLESGNYNPSLDFLIRVSEALGKSLSVQLM